jgi:hypothetical protein
MLLNLYPRTVRVQTITPVLSQVQQDPRFPLNSVFRVIIVESLCTF